MKLFTEDEARTKLCPVIDRMCQAGGCMAWRFADNDGRGYCGMVPHQWGLSGEPQW
jgi:hypothetical protein